MDKSVNFDIQTLSNLLIEGVELDPLPQWRQLYHRIKTAILKGYLKTNTRLPSSRDMAKQLGLSRNTITAAFDQLIAEGYLISKQGSGTFVANISPDDALFLQNFKPAITNKQNPLNLSNRGLHMSAITRPNFSQTSRYTPFQSGVPDLSYFPKVELSKIFANVTKTANADQLDYDYSGGLVGFRQAIASYLAASRGVICNADQVLIVSGSQAALDMIARMMIDIDDDIWIEHPGYGGAYSAFNSAGAKFNALPIINDRHDFETAIKNCPNPKLAYLTPSHQHPTGVTMNLKDRQTILQLAQKHNFWVIEDDYDSEFRYDGRPLAALQGQDQSERVIYLGTFSKTLSPALRCAYIILPKKLISPFKTALFNSGMMVPNIMQMALTQFINEGQYMLHIRKMRTLYNARRIALLAAIKIYAADFISPMQSAAGMHFAVKFKHPKLLKLGDNYISEQLQKHNISNRPLSAYALQALEPDQQGLLLGFAPFTEKQLTDATHKMVNVFNKLVE